MNKYKSELCTPIGLITIISDGEFINEIVFGSYKEILPEDSVSAECKRQLIEYFDGKRKQFDINIMPKGSEFSQKVWSALQKIQYGQTVSYEQLAVMAGCPKAKRAVGNANGKNPIPIIIPCHRVIRKDGSIGGYSGGLNIKEYLLSLEGSNNG